MIRLLQIEFIKLWNNRTSKILIYTYFILLSFIALIATIKIGPVHLAEEGIFEFPLVWHFNTYVAAFFKLFLAVVIVSMIANEYSNRTLKQNLIDGLSKKEFITSKFLTIVAFALLSTIFITIMSLILGLIFSNTHQAVAIFADLEYIVAYFIKHIGFFSFCLFLAMLIKRSAFALGLLFIWFIFENILYGLLIWLVVTKVTADKILAFFPLQSMYNLITNPGTRLEQVSDIVDEAAQQNISFDHDVHWYNILIVLIWTAIFIYSAYRLLKKRDL